MNVKDCMSTKVCYCTPENSVKDVAKLMCDNHVGCIPVCNDNNCVVGVITDRDVILRSIACDKDVCNTKVTDIMTCNPCCCTEDTTIDEATNLMSKFQIRRIPVCDANNKIVGILSLGDLAHHDGEVGKAEVCATLENICKCNGNTKNAE